ncbi:hypothetical protein DXV76_05570 [Rhodobacteraceae bacterium CCMM004]|nr:hypothetical protein DXV76_05570 [Rhodobacteraceae bacterium CCMM004]
MPLADAPSVPRFARPVFTPVAVPRLPLSHAIAALLMTPVVQSIQFRFGYYKRTAKDWTAMAEALMQRRVRVRVDAAAVTDIGDQTAAFYEPWGRDGVPRDTIVFPNHDTLSTPVGRATAIHECSHAIRDMRGGPDARLHDESAAYICGIWYQFATEGQAAIPGDAAEARVLQEVVSALFQREPGREGVVRAQASEVNAMRAAVRRLGRKAGYTNTLIPYDGVPRSAG